VKTLLAIALLALAQLALAQTSNEPARKGADLNLNVGKSTLLRLPDPIDRISVANPAIADVVAISAREI
jgi:pilus assembly protein CpaC